MVVCGWRVGLRVVGVVSCGLVGLGVTPVLWFCGLGRLVALICWVLLCDLFCCFFDVGLILVLYGCVCLVGWLLALPDCSSVFWGLL